MKHILLTIAWIFAIHLTSCGQGLLIQANEKFSGIKNLEVKGRFCNVQVVGHESTMVEFSGQIKGLRHVDGFAIRHEKKGDHLTVWVETPRVSWGNVNGDLQFWVPKDCILLIDNGSGNINVSNLQYAGLVLNNGSGNIRLNDIISNSRAKTASGNIYVENHIGDIDAVTSSGSHHLKKITGDLLVKSASGSININDLNGNLRAEAASGGIRLADVIGALKLKTSSGSIRGSGVRLTENSSFISSSGSISMNLLNPVRDLGFDLTSGSGGINVNGEKTSRKYVKNNNGAILINAESSSGSQTFTTSKTGA
jgi:hypothetical protein